MISLSGDARRGLPDDDRCKLGKFAERLAGGFLVIRIDGARTWADGAAEVAPAVERTTRGKRLSALNPEGSDERNLTTLDGREVESPTSGCGGDLSTAARTRAGLFALAVAVSAGIHIGLTPEHLEEMPRLGVSFIVAAVLSSAIAVALVARPDDRRIAALTGLFRLGEILAWVLFVTIRVPFFPDPRAGGDHRASLQGGRSGRVGARSLGRRLGRGPTHKRATSAYRVSTSRFGSIPTPMSPSSFRALLGRSPTAWASPTDGHTAPRVGRS